MQFHTHVLPNGLRIVGETSPSARSVALGFWVRTGARDETPEVNGVSNLLAALITRGTETRTGDQIAYEIESLAGGIGGFSGRNSFGLRAEVLASNGERALALLADCIGDPSFASDELERERRLVLEELRTQVSLLGVHRADEHELGRM